MMRPEKRKFGPYITLKTIGTGETNTVYTAMHETTGRMVALRVMTITTKNVKQALADCNAVLSELSQIQLDNTVKIEEFGNDGSVLYIAMTVMNGGTLQERINRRIDETQTPQLPSSTDILQLAEQLAQALDALHAIGMVHGQIEPQSIMFDDKGEAFLADVGLTRIFKIVYRLDASNSFNMTHYSAPELWNGERPSPSTDQYALACILYQLLTGQVPFEGKNSIFALMTAHLEDVAAPPHYIREELPQDLAMIFWQALAKQIDRRYPSVTAFYQDLQEVLRDSPAQKTDFFTFMLD